MKTANYSDIDKEKLNSLIKDAQTTNKFLKEKYDINSIQSWKDVPGWINDAEWIYEKMVNTASDGDYFVEIGTYFGQSACRMGELIKNSGKKIHFDSIDSYYTLDPSMRANFHPQQFIEYRMSKELVTAPIKEIAKMHLYKCGVQEFVNLLCIESELCSKLYKNKQLKFVYIDGSHLFEDVYKDLINIWPKIKNKGILAGDDVMYDDVKNALNLFIKKNRKTINSISINNTSFIIEKK